MSLDPKIPKTGWNTTATKAKGQEATKATKAKATKAKGQVAKEQKAEGQQAESREAEGQEGVIHRNQKRREQ